MLAFALSQPNRLSFADKLIYWLNLNASFAVDTVIPQNTLQSEQSEGSQWQSTGAFFIDPSLTTIYSYGGFNQLDTFERNSVYSYDTESQTWANVTVEGGSFNRLGRIWSSSTTSVSSSLGLGFITGGFERFVTRNTMAAVDDPPGMIQFDASDPTTLKWTNVTENVPPMVGASMQFARFGNKGVLIVVGGYSHVC